MAVQVERIVVVPDEVVRRDEAAGGEEIRRGRKRHVHCAERRMQDAEVVAEGLAAKADDLVLERDAGVEHGHRDRRARGRLNVPRALEIDQRQIPLKLTVERVVRHQHLVDAPGRLRVLDIGIGGERCGDGGCVLVLADADHVEIRV